MPTTNQYKAALRRHINKLERMLTQASAEDKAKIEIQLERSRAELGGR